MGPELEQLLKESFSSLALILGGFYLKVAKDKEPLASKNMWKIVIIIGVIGFILSVGRYLY
ncbi:hypothetical protein [Rubrolithibacter danxiaensis]|uniref:hypothetical protein n=1 Tax=Rubrolithibacter danxiaensis TaxID=3390805 RepID=UPI003BF914BF